MLSGTAMTLDLEDITVRQTDVNDLSRQWHLVMSNVEYPSSATAMRLLAALVMAYLRGRGCRMGTDVGRARHTEKARALIRAVSEHATDHFEDMGTFTDGVKVYLESAPRGR